MTSKSRSAGSSRFSRIMLLIARRSAVMDQLAHLHSMGAFENPNIFTVDWVKRISNLSGVTCYSTIVNVMTTYVSCFESSISVPFQSELNAIIDQCTCNHCNPDKPGVPRDHLFLRRLILKNRRRDISNLHRQALINSHQEHIASLFSQKCYSAVETLVSVLMDTDVDKMLDERIESLC